ncbi:AtzG-like protein [Hydrogenophaga sp. OTU3427]|uniref:AtzG-like protein n=1 Tax=Hydrogenophaga sp. OTU3427 TaxID=3043856 RepID=UPI00313DB444
MSPDQIEAYVDAAAAALALPLEPAHRDGVLRYFALAAQFADQVQAVELDASAEPSMSFVPLSPTQQVTA